MAEKPHKKQIEIERNPVEKALLAVKEFAKERKRPLRIGFLSVLIITVLAVAAVVFVNLKTDRNQRELEKLLTRYDKAMASGDERELGAIVKEAQTFIDSSWFGTAHRLGYYIQGSVLYRQKQFKPAAEKYRTFAKSNSRSSILTPLAYLKAATAFEEAGDYAGAEDMYRVLEEKFEDRATAELAYYNRARLMAKKNNREAARRYYNKVIQMYPDSPLAEKSRKRLFLLGAGEADSAKK